jgi:Ca2+-binding EF-hand superfamily protein
MIFSRYSLLFAPVLLLAASAASSQDRSQNVQEGMTLERFLNRQTSRIMAADTDGDGRVSRAELEAVATKGRRDPSRLFDRMDSNHDGYLDKGEIQAALTMRFHRMDHNDDGIVTPDERMAGRMDRGPGERAGDAPSQR